MSIVNLILILLLQAPPLGPADTTLTADVPDAPEPKSMSTEQVDDEQTLVSTPLGVRSRRLSVTSTMS